MSGFCLSPQPTVCRSPQADSLPAVGVFTSHTEDWLHGVRRTRHRAGRCFHTQPTRCHSVLTSPKGKAHVNSCPELTTDCGHGQQFTPYAVPHIPEEDKHITEILAEQLAEQHIPLNLPLHFLPAQEHDQFQPSQQIDPALSQPTLFMQQPSAVQSTDKSFYQPALLQHCPKSAESQHLEGFSIQSTVPGKTESDNHTQHAWQEALPAFQRPGHVLHQALTDLALSAVTASRAESQGVSHQSAEMLQVTNSRVHTWLGLALRQAFLRPDQLHRENEASVQDAAGGGGLLHGGPEDGGEGGGPSRGWGGAAGEEGDAEDDEDDDDDDEDEDEDQDEDDDDVDDSSSDGSCQHTCAGLEHDWPHAGSHSGSDEAMQVFATPEADCNIRPAHQTTGYCLSEGGQVHAERLQAPADLNDVNRSSQAMLYPSMTVPVQRPPYAHHAVAFRTRRRFIGGPRLNSFGAQIRCRHADGAQQNHEHKKQQCGLKSRSWSKVPQFVLYTLINVVGCSL